MAGRSRNWVFTLNNPPQPYPDLIVAGSTYLKYQLEKGAAGTLHFQGFVLFSTLKSLASMRRLIPNAHLEVMRGSVKDSEKYCTKNDETYVEGPWSTGVAPVGSGTRTDLLAVQAAVQAGMTEAEIANEHFGTWLRHFRGIERYRRLVVSHRYPLTPY